MVSTASTSSPARSCCASSGGGESSAGDSPADEPRGVCACAHPRVEYDAPSTAAWTIGSDLHVLVADLEPEPLGLLVVDTVDLPAIPICRPPGARAPPGSVLLR